MKIRTTVSWTIRIFAVILFFCSFLLTSGDHVLQLRFLLGFVGLSYLAHSIYPIRTAPWEPDYEKLWISERCNEKK